MIGFLVIPFAYLEWHYTRAFLDMLRVWWNLFRFIFDFFSIPLLVRTLLSPWRRLEERRRVGGGVEDFFSVLIVNIIVRIVGAVMRLVIIAIGLVSLVLAIGLGIAFVLIWISAPLLVGAGLVRGLSLMLYNV